jgi:hypothetical protein
MTETITLYRPVGANELKLIADAEYKAFPPRLPDQPIFYPVTNEEYARQIAKDWNSRINDDKQGFVTKFAVKMSVAGKYNRKVVGGSTHEELWVPAEDLDAFNDAIVGKIEIIAKFENDQEVDH